MLILICLSAIRFIEIPLSRTSSLPGESRATETGKHDHKPILDRAYGKAPTFSSTDTTQFKRAIDMTDDELAAIVAKAKLTVIK